MLTLYWGFLITGIIFALITILFGDILDGILDGLFESMDGLIFDTVVFRSFITSFGGAGVLFTRFTSNTSSLNFLLAVLAATLVSLVAYFIYIKPMKSAENSTGFSMQDLVGKPTEVITPIPVNGYGEVIVKIGVGRTNQVAKSIDDSEIAKGSEVEVVEVREGILYIKTKK